jgi:hypothetical protein
MPWGFDTIKDFIEIAIQALGLVAIGGAIAAFFLTKKQLNFSVMISCIERFQNILPGLESTDPETKDLAIRRYIDLCNEEIFYFQQGYIPDVVIEEWIEGMAFYLPWFNKRGDIVRPANLKIKEELLEKMLEGYPRIRRTFTFTQSYNLTIDAQKLSLITAVQNNYTDTLCGRIWLFPKRFRKS